MSRKTEIAKVRIPTRAIVEEDDHNSAKLIGDLERKLQLQKSQLDK